MACCAHFHEIDEKQTIENDEEKKSGTALIFWKIAQIYIVHRRIPSSLDNAAFDEWEERKRERNVISSCKTYNFVGHSFIDAAYMLGNNSILQ